MVPEEGSPREEQLAWWRYVTVLFPENNSNGRAGPPPGVPDFLEAVPETAASAVRKEDTPSIATAGKPGVGCRVQGSGLGVGV